MSSELLERVERLTVRQVTFEAIVSTALAFVLRSITKEMRRELLTELRRCVSVSTLSFSDPAKAETMALVAEEEVDRLLDQIERIARSPEAPR